MRYAGKLLLILPLLFLVPLVVYLWGAAPTVMYFDGAELQAVALMGGVAHPSGYPTYILFGQLFGRALTGDPAHRITVMSSFFGAATVCLLSLVLLKFGVSVLPALIGALVYGASFTFWWSAIQAEVYTLSLFLFLISLWLTLHALERPTLTRALLAGAGMGLVATGHLVYLPAILVMLVILATRKPVSGLLRSKYLVILLLSFLGGLTPYLSRVWADMGDYPINYLKYSIELSSGQFGLSERTFDSPWERIPWLIFRRQYETTNNFLYPGSFIRHLFRVIFFEFTYHFGPVALPMYALGVYQAVRRAGKKRYILFGVLIVSAIAGAGLGTGRMLHIIIMPLTLCTAVVISFGVWYFMERCIGREGIPRTLKAVIISLLLIGLVVLPHLVRLQLDRSTTFPQQLKMQVEADLEVDSLIPSFRNYWEPRIYGERVLELVPENSLVIGRWNEIMVLYYLKYVECRRPDIELEPYYDAHFIRLERWQNEHDVATHPFVFLGTIGKLTDDLAGLDSVRVDHERSLYVYRKPLEKK
jgi:hypothetical protein